MLVQKLLGTILIDKYNQKRQDDYMKLTYVLELLEPTRRKENILLKGSVFYI